MEARYVDTAMQLAKVKSIFTMIRWETNCQGKHADWLQKMTALLLKLEPLVVTERWEAHKVRFFGKVSGATDWMGTVQADTTILEECVEAVAVGVGNIWMIIILMMNAADATTMRTK